MPTHRPHPVHEILFRMTVRYLTVRPEGLVIDPDRHPVRQVDGRILAHGGARTLYRGRRPACRSLDGLRSVTDTDRECTSCPDAKSCTPQVRVDLLLDSRPFRLLLAYTSAKNFLLYEADLRARKRSLEETPTRIDVVGRGSWGELRFSEIPKPPAAL